jgi:hypothetical protein
LKSEDSAAVPTAERAAGKPVIYGGALPRARLHTAARRLSYTSGVAGDSACARARE